MAYRGKIDFSKLTVDQIAKLNNYQFHRYQVWNEGQKKRKEIRNEFEDALRESCDRYIFYR